MKIAKQVKQKIFSKLTEILESNKDVIMVSHNDMDGYGCAYVVESLYQKKIPTIHTNYGDIIDDINVDILNPDIALIITDLNLTINEASLIDELTDGDWICIDHHMTGKQTQAEFRDNYFLNTDYSATYQTYALFSEYLMTGSKELKSLVNIINAYDIYLTSTPEFKKGLLLNSLFYKYRFEVDILRNKYIYHIFKLAEQYDLLNTSVSSFEKIYAEHLRIFANTLISELSTDYQIDDPDNTPIDVIFSMLHAPYVSSFITHETEEFVIIEGLSTSVTQYANSILFKLDEFKDKVIINLSDKGTVAFRSINNKAGELAKKAGGGGHPNAGGCKLNKTHDNYLDELLSLLDDKLDCNVVIDYINNKEAFQLANIIKKYKLSISDILYTYDQNKNNTKKLKKRELLSLISATVDIILGEVYEFHL